MTIDQNSDKAHLDKHPVDPYKAAWEREKQARILAERALDERTREIYSSMQLVQQQFKSLQKNNSELTAAMENLKYAQEQLVQSEKMASLGQLSAGVAHEINNPITFILLNLETFREYSSTMVELINKFEQHFSNSKQNLPKDIETYEKQQDIDFIRQDITKVYTDCTDGLNRVKDIVNNLKNFARADDGEMLPCNINECIESTLKVIWNELKYTITLHKNYGEIPDTIASSNQLSQVFMNLLVNATHAMAEKEVDGNIFITTSSDSTHIYIRIRDDGCGIPEEIHKKIFDPFFTTKAVNKGTGLGLSISYGIIEKHKGEISFTSKVNEGTEFIIKLPIQSSPEN